ncbi:MAG TPA: OmpA family protein [Acidimicrobiales bacterium]|nr:OmpA family protein [Acidimicrobiales bacterium]
MSLLLCASAAIVPAAAGSAHGGGLGGPHGSGGPGESGGSGGSGGSNSGGSSGDTSDGAAVVVTFANTGGNATVTYPTPYSPPPASDGVAGATFTYAITGSNTAGCSINADESGFSYRQPGSCVISATTAVVSTTDDDHDATSSASGTLTLTVNPGVQSISLASTSGPVGTAITLSATGYSGSGTITYKVVGGTAAGCGIVHSDQVISSGAGTCLATATIAATTYYASATSAPATITFIAPTPVVTPPTTTPTTTSTTTSTTTTTTTTIPKHLTITAPSQSVKKGQAIRTRVSVSGVAPGDSVSVTKVTLTYTGIEGTSYGPNTAAPSQVGVYSVMPSNATISVSPAADAKRYSGTILYVAGTLQILVPDLVVKAAPPRLSPTRSLAIKPFAEGSYALNRKLVKQVARLALVIKRGQYHSVALTGFTDNVFTPAFNVMLNQRRAAAVQARLYADLLRLHVKNVKISIVASFSVQLVSTNTTAKGRAQNRRVVAVLRAL